MAEKVGGSSIGDRFAADTPADVAVDPMSLEQVSSADDQIPPGTESCPEDDLLPQSTPNRLW